MRILFVDIDTLRPDHMGCYGYQRNTTPNMDRIAQEGVKFTNYYCSDAPCLPSRAALMSGVFGIRNGVVGHGGTGADLRLVGEKREFESQWDLSNFNNIFRRAGLYTASISSFPERHSAWWFSARMHETHNIGDCGRESGEEILPIALDWLERNKDRDNWFLHVNFWDPHTPYRAPEEFGNPFEDDELDNWITDEVLAQHLKHTGPHGANEIMMYHDQVPERYPRHPGKVTDRAGLKKIFDGYDCGIRYADYLIGQIFDKLREQGIYDDTAIIISADHGENIGELGLYAEHGTADHITCNIPMIIKWPGSMKDHTDNGLHYSLDILPTLAELLGVEKCKTWDGESYYDSLMKGSDTGRDSLVLSQMAHVCQRTARFGDWVYIRTIHDGYHLYDDEMLFNIKEDKYEEHDVKEQHPDICAKGAKIILDWHDAEMKKSDSMIDPMWQVMKENGPYHTWGQLPAYLERLEKTGRADGAEKLRKKYLSSN